MLKNTTSGSVIFPKHFKHGSKWAFCHCSRVRTRAAFNIASLSRKCVERGRVGGRAKHELALNPPCLQQVIRALLLVSVRRDMLLLGSSRVQPKILITVKPALLNPMLTGNASQTHLLSLSPSPPPPVVGAGHIMPASLAPPNPPDTKGAFSHCQEGGRGMPVIGRFIIGLPSVLSALCNRILENPLCGSFSGQWFE